MPVGELTATNEKVQSATMHLWPEEPRSVGESIEYSARLEIPNHESVRLWYRVPEQFAGYVLTGRSDPFLVGLMQQAMGFGGELHVHGPASPTLIDNLTEFQKAWCMWQPSLFKPLRIVCPEQSELPKQIDDCAIGAFSMGLDSTCMMFSNVVERSWRVNVKAGLFVHGLDIPLRQEPQFGRASDRARKLLSTIGCELLTVSTNFRDFDKHWDMDHGSALASCLMLFAKRFNTALIASSYSYDYLRTPWGSNPTTDPLMSSANFRIIHDGASLSRGEKFRLVAQRWPDGARVLRVCWRAANGDENCGCCTKCVVVIALYASLRLPVPEGLGRDFRKECIGKLTFTQYQCRMLEGVFAQLKNNNPDGELFPLLRQSVRYSRIRQRLEQCAAGRAGEIIARLGLFILKCARPLL